MSLTFHSVLRKLYTEPSIFRFQRRIFFFRNKQKQELPMVAMFVNGSGQNEQFLERTFLRCFLPSFTSFGLRVSEEKIKMWKVDGQQEMAKAHLAFGLTRWAIQLTKNDEVDLSSVVPEKWIFLHRPNLNYPVAVAILDFHPYHSHH